MLHIVSRWCSLVANGSGAGKGGTRKPRFRLRLEELESRFVPALVINGSFEDVSIAGFFSANPADVPGWTHSGASGDSGILIWRLGYSDNGGTGIVNGQPVTFPPGSLTVAGAGQQFVTMGGGFDAVGTASWQQVVTGLTPGSTYILTFKMASENIALAQSITVDFPTGSATPAQTFTAAAAPADYWMDWESKSMTFVANAASVDVRFSAMTQFDVGLDDVSINPSLYSFGGFQAPLAGGGSYHAGSTIPITFTLSDLNGNPITALNAVTTLQILYTDGQGNTTLFTPTSTNGN